MKLADARRCVLRVSPQGDLLAFFEYDNAVGDFAVTVLDYAWQQNECSPADGRRGRAELGRRGEMKFGIPAPRLVANRSLRAVKTNGEERSVVGCPGWMNLQDVARDGRLLATIEDSRVGIMAFTPKSARKRDLSWFDASRIYDISSRRQNDPICRNVIRKAAQYGDLSAKNGWLAGRPAGGWQPAHALARWQVGGLYPERWAPNHVDSIADRRGRSTIYRRS